MWQTSPDLRLSSALAQALLDDRQPGLYNQAIMDLAAAHCRARAPECGSCPVETWCADPSISTSVPAQARFEGSRRQVRGAILRHLGGAADLSEAALVGNLPHDQEQISAGLESLVAEGLVSVEDGRYRLGD